VTAMVAPADMPRVGDLLRDRWAIEGELGRGGMGIVYRAYDCETHKAVAVKLLADDAFVDAELTYRFRREGDIPHTVRVLGMHRLPSGRPFLVMELLRGKHLGAIARERVRVPSEEVVEWMLGICDAVGEAHRAGIVHRDLKLANLFLAETATGPMVKVLDFGIAKRHESSLSLTGTLAMMGTPHFMPPEQFT
jgi:eukaryotic-like serine/threonine-protein kinase